MTAKPNKWELAISASPPKADVDRHDSHVPFVREAKASQRSHTRKLQFSEPLQSDLRCPVRPPKNIRFDCARLWTLRRAVRSPPARHQTALRLGDALDVALGGLTMHRRERLYVQSVKTISDRICNRASRRNSVLADCNICAQCRDVRDRRQNERGSDDTGTEKVTAVMCSQDIGQGSSAIIPMNLILRFDPVHQRCHCSDEIKPARRRVCTTPPRLTTATE
jgi:hypothetical protein